MFKTYEEYYKHLNELGNKHPDLLLIYQKYVDETGRPYSSKYPSNMILEIIERNQNSKNQFIQEMKILSPEKKEKEFEIYYDMFVGGMEFLSKELKKDFKTNQTITNKLK